MRIIMEFFNQFLISEEITWETAFIRIILSFILGTIVGIERETHNQPAGLRTHILICIGATLIMLISIYVPQSLSDFKNTDPARIASQVVSGIGFLGAGAILKFGVNVKGLTTAASIWTMAAVGLAVGAGMYMISIISVVVIILALVAMNLFEKSIFEARTLRTIQLEVKKKHLNIQSLKETFNKYNIKIASTGFERNVNEANDKITYRVGVRESLNVQEFTDALGKHPGIVSVAIELID